MIIFDREYDLLEVGLACLALTGALLITAIIAGIHDGIVVFKRWWFLLSWTRHLADVETEAHEIDEVRSEVEELYRKVHYRHNIHCPLCGRFAKRVPDLPDGVSDCKVHGIHMRTVEYTGMIDVEIRLVRLNYPPPMPLPTPREMWDQEHPEIVVDYHDEDWVPDEMGLPVFTQPLAIEEPR